MRKLGKALIAFVLLCLAGSIGYANNLAKSEKTVQLAPEQQEKNLRTVTGKVLDVEGLGLPGASVYIPGTSVGATTDIDGNFQISVPYDAKKLLISYIGMEDKELILGGQTNYEIVMQAGAIGLGEVVAIGYGTSKKEDVSTAVGKVESLDKIGERPVTTLGDFLQGNLAGVTVSQKGGDPTQSPDIHIRGRGSVNEEPPLYIVDGLPYYGPPINPSDIDKVTILKDAAAASIYGAQAAGGVIVISTKKGKLGRAQINLNLSTSFQKTVNLPKALKADEQAYVYTTAAMNDGVKPSAAHNPALNPWGQRTRNDWIDAIFRMGKLDRISADISGASEKINYYTSLEYLKKEGILLGTGFDRYAVRSKGDVYLSENFKGGVNLYYSLTEAKGTDTKSGYSSTILNAIYMPSAAPTYGADGKFHGVVPNSLVDFAGAYGEVYNPVALLLRPTIKNPLNNFNGSAYLSYTILKGLKAKTTFGYNTTHKHNKRFVPRIPEIGRADKQNYLHESFTDTRNWTWDNQLTYNNSFGLHNINLTLVHSAQETNYEYSYTQGRNFSSEEPFNHFMGAAGEIYGQPKYEKYKIRSNSLIGRTMYNYDRRYYLSTSLRRDETSKLNPEGNYQEGIFPSFSAAWRISQESFFNINAINELKIRASWGQVGNVMPLSPYAFDAPLKRGKVIIGNNGGLDYLGVYTGVQSNSFLKWETTESYDIGLDLDLFNSKLSFIFDFFNKKTKELIIRGLPDSHHGTKPPFVNGGEVQNKGFEFTVNYKDKIGDLKYRIGGNLSKIKNKLINLDGYSRGGVEFIANKTNVRGTLYPFSTKNSMIGDEIYSFYLIPQLGIFQTQQEIDSYVNAKGEKIQENAKPGDFKFKDTNGDGKIDDNDKVNSGSYNPDFTYAFNLELDYKGFDLNAVFQGVSGVKIFNAYKFETYNAGLQGFNLDNRVLGAWSLTNRNTDIPRLSTKDSNQNFGRTSDWYLENGSYFRLKNLTVGYTFPQLISFISNARLYFSAENLFTITKYTGMNPEVGNNGLDNGQYPLARIYSIGLNIQF